MKHRNKLVSTLCLIGMAFSLLSGCQETPAAGSGESVLNGDQKEATEITTQLNQSVYDQLNFDDQQELKFAQRSLISAPDSLELKNADGKVIWSQDAYAFLKDADAPDTVNPSLWRNTQLNYIYGLFEVTYASTRCGATTCPTLSLSRATPAVSSLIPSCRWSVPRPPNSWWMSSWASSSRFWTRLCRKTAFTWLRSRGTLRPYRYAANTPSRSPTWTWPSI